MEEEIVCTFIDKKIIGFNMTKFCRIQQNFKYISFLLNINADNRPLSASPGSQPPCIRLNLWKGLGEEKLTMYCASWMPNLSLRFRNTRGQYSLNLKWLGMLSLKRHNTISPIRGPINHQHFPTRKGQDLNLALNSQCVQDICQTDSPIGWVLAA